MKHKPLASISDTGPAKGPGGRAAPLTKQVLLVDDDWELLIAMAEYIRRQGCEVTLTAEAREALAILRHDHFDLVVTDLQLLVMDGRQLLKKIRALSPHTPVVVTTGQSKAQLEHTGGIPGANAVLHKPFDLRQLADTLERQLYCRDISGNPDGTIRTRQLLPADH